MHLRLFYAIKLTYLLIAMAGCLSVSLSVTLTYRDVIGWNTSKMISRLVSLGVRSLQNPTSWIYSKGTPRNSSWNRDAVWKRGFPRKKTLISLKRSKIVPCYYWGPYALSIGATTLDDLEGSLYTLFQNTCAMMLLFIYLEFHF